MNRNTNDVAARNACGNAVELYFRVARWLALHPQPIHWLDVAVRWDVDRATAYRWLAAWRAATINPLPRLPSPAATGTTATPIQGPRNDP